MTFEEERYSADAPSFEDDEAAIDKLPEGTCSLPLLTDGATGSNDERPGICGNSTKRAVRAAPC